MPSAVACATSRWIDVSPIPRRAIRDPHQRDRVVGVVQQREVGYSVLDLGALVEPRPADHLVRHALADKHVLEDAQLGVRPVEDRDLGCGVAELHETGYLRRDEACLRVLVFDLDHLHGVAVAELRPQPFRLPVAVVVDDRVRRPEDRVRRAVVLLERDRVGPTEVLLEVEDVANVGAAQSVDRLVRIAHHEQVPMFAASSCRRRYWALLVSWYSSIRM